MNPAQPNERPGLTQRRPNPLEGLGHRPVWTSTEVEAMEILTFLWDSWTAKDEVWMGWPANCLVDHDPSLFKIEVFVDEVNREVAIESI